MNHAKWMPIAGVFLAINILAVIGTSVRHFASAQGKGSEPSQGQSKIASERTASAESPESGSTLDDRLQLQSDPNALQATISEDADEVATGPLSPLAPASPLDSLEIPPAGPTSDLENEPFFREFMDYFTERGGIQDKTEGEELISQGQTRVVSRLAIERSLARASSAEHLAIAIQELLAQADRDYQAGETASAAELFQLVQRLQKLSGELISR
ncbi:MAG: hypothetical protein ACE361_08050 [Aureliella sp.]